jgi:hypothetical protein
MRIDFRDAQRVNELGYAGFLRILPVNRFSRYLGALLTVNANGEPAEFTYNYVEMNHPELWGGIDREQYAIRRLSASILKKCVIAPQLVLCLAGETYHELFHSEILLAVPVCCVEARSTEEGKLDITDDNRASGSTKTFLWTPENPAEGSMAQVLFDELNCKGITTELFERTAAGLKEVFSIPVDA